MPFKVPPTSFLLVAVVLIVAVFWLKVYARCPFEILDHLLLDPMEVGSGLVVSSGKGRTLRTAPAAGQPFRAGRHAGSSLKPHTVPTRSADQKMALWKGISAHCTLLAHRSRLINNVSPGITSFRCNPYLLNPRRQPHVAEELCSALGETALRLLILPIATRLLLQKLETPACTTCPVRSAACPAFLPSSQLC